MTRRQAGALLLLLLLQPGCVVLDKRSGTQPLEEGPTLPPAESARACEAVAANLAARGHADQAIEKLLKARQFDPNSDVSSSLARLYAKTQNDRLALDEFARAIDKHPEDADLWNDLGYFHYQRGNWSESAEKLRKAVAVNPKHARAWMNLGLALGQQEKYPESLAAFEKAVRPAEARCNLAFVMTTQGKFDEARRLYHEALTLDPGLKVARLALANLDRPGTTPVAGKQPGRLTLPDPFGLSETDGPDDKPGT